MRQLLRHNFPEKFVKTYKRSLLRTIKATILPERYPILKRLYLFFLLLCFTFCKGAVYPATAQTRPETLISTQCGYVVCEDSLSQVLLYAVYHDKGLYAQHLRIEVRDATDRSLQAEIHPTVDYGYAPKLKLFDFMENGLAQLYLSSDSGGSGAFAFCEIFDVRSGTPTSIFSNDSFDRQYRYTAAYQDGFRIKIQRSGPAETYLIDISCREKAYLDQLYLPDGKLKAPQTADISQLNTCFPYYNATADRWQLCALQRITGLYSADAYGYLIHLMQYEHQGFSSYFSMAGILPCEI